MTEMRNCTPLHEKEIENLATARAVTATVCAVLFVIFCAVLVKRQCSKQHKRPGMVERLLIYMAIGAFLPWIGFAIHGYERISSSDDYNDTSNICKVAAYLVQSLEWAQLLIFSGVVIALTVITCCHKKKKIDAATNVNDQQPAWRYPLRLVCSVELGLVFFAAIVSFVVNVTPLVKHDYGESGPWCWITYKNPKHNCTRDHSGFMEQIFLWYMWFGVINLACVVFTIATLVYTCCKKPRCDRHSISTVFLLVYLFFSFGLASVEVSARFLDRMHTHRNYDLWMAYAVLTPISKLPLPVIVALAYADCFTIWGIRNRRGYDPINVD